MSGTQVLVSKTACVISSEIHAANSIGLNVFAKVKIPMYCPKNRSKSLLFFFLVFQYANAVFSVYLKQPIILNILKYPKKS